MCKKSMRLCSMILMFAMLINMLPVQAKAVSLTPESMAVAEPVEISSTAPAAQEEEVPVTIVGEAEELRTENTKHFRMSDGSFTAVSYGIPVHYQDEDGGWQEINNVPVTTMDASGRGAYLISNGNTGTAFASTLSDGHLATVFYEDKSVGMFLLDGSQAMTMTCDDQATVVDTEQESSVYNRNAVGVLESDNSEVATTSDDPTEYNSDFMLENLQSSILYENVYPGIDIRYTAWSYHVKEEIIVKSLQENYRYDFFLALDGLAARENSDRSISLLDADNTEIYLIPAPYMIDTAGETSEQVSYTLTQVEGGLVLTVEADETWIESEARVLPVSIDPSITTRQLAAYHTAADDIYATYVHPGYPNGSNYYGGGLYTGYSSKYEFVPYITYLHFNNLPEVPVGSVISEAKVQLYVSKFSGTGCTSMPIGMFPVTDPIPEGQTAHSWFTGMTYVNKPAYDSTDVIDFTNITSTSAQTYASWDMTSLVRGWYAGEDNRTVALAPVGTYTTSNHAWQCYLASGDYVCPVLTVTYRNSYGLEDYYTYQGLGAGAAGSAYITDSTGQVKVVTNLLGHSSEAQPFSLNLIYNSDYFANSDADYVPPAEMGLNMSVGSGWTLDCVQNITGETIVNKYYLKHRDGDGTIHYYKKLYSTSQYYTDEDGLNLRIAGVGTNAYRLEDGYNNYQLFRNNVLSETVDWDGNTTYFKYTDDQITSITQKNKNGTEITLATLVYDNNVLTTVTDAAGNVYTLGYTDGNLTSVKKNDTVLAQYSYNGHRVTKMTDVESGYAVNFAYDSQGRIAGYSESVGDAAGAAVTVSYPGMGHTVYRDHGPDRLPETADDLLCNYLYDFSGRTINTYVTDNDLNIYGAANAVYTEQDTTGKTNNRILRSASTGIVAEQLLSNAGFENGSWIQSNTSVSEAKPRTGTKSLVGTSADATAVQYAQATSVTLTAGKTYTFSGYVDTSGMEFTGKGVYLKVTDSSENIWLGNPVAYASSSAVDNGWVRLSVTFTAKVSGTHTLSIYREGATGTFYADDFQLEQGEAPSSYNMLENGGMNDASAWTMGTGASISSGTLEIVGDPAGTDALAYQDVPVNLPGSQTYVLAGWVKAEAVPDTVNTAADPAQDTVKQCGLRAMLTYSDGTTEYHYVPFNTDVTTWQFVSYAIIPKESDKTVSTIRVICTYEKNVNTAQFDNITLIREVAQAMRYDENGLLLSVTTTGQGTDVNTYTVAKLLQKTVTAGNGTYTYSYNNTNNPYRASSVTNGLTTESYSYDLMGHLLSTTISGSGGKKIVTSATYSSDGYRTETVTDASGNTISYAYGTADSQMLGLPTSVTAPNGTITSTEYDGFNRVAQTGIANTANLLYTYDKGNLKTIQRTDNASNTQTYSFTHDAFGNNLSIKVGNRNLATYEYAANNGYLVKQTDANGNTVTFVYDHLGRVKTATYSGGLVLTYTYTGEGTLYSVTATENGNTTTYLYGYDSLGRLISGERLDNGASILRTRQAYDEVNRPVYQAWQVGGTLYEEGYTYNSEEDGSLNTHTTATGQTLTMQYDGLRRLSGITGGIYGKSYTYRDISSTQTTTQIASVVYDLPTDQSYGYTYNNMGNIATYTDANGTVTYTYDAQGQLLSATDGTTTYSYTYDTVGNILTANGHTYSYTNADWKDLLTAYDGETITYDAIGNPLSYYNGTRWTFTWEDGRQLATATDGTTNVSYTYDSDGIRISKTVNGVTHTYVYASGKLLRETYGDTTLDFFYSNSGQPYALKHNGTTYYYITNVQGDVMSIVDGTGAVVAEYEYDPYGNILSTTGTLADTLGQINPLRYRGYVYDQETGLYYLQSRYYDAKVGRFLNPDSYPSTGQGIIGNNMFAYCGNNPIMHTDSSGHAWWHWAVAAAVVVAAAVAVVATAGGAAAAVTAVVSVANGVAASSTAATVAAGVFIGSATSFAASTYAAAVESDSIEEFAEHGETVMYSTIDGGIYGGVVAYGMTDQPCPSSCFVAGTHVQVANGTVPIESLEAGDVVWAWDEETGDVALKTVVETYVNETDELIHVFANGEEIVTTHSHPFYSPIKGWTDAIHLRAGDILVLVNGEYVVVEKVQHEILEVPVTVYNFQVEDYHTYFVSFSGILVHNRCTPPSDLPKDGTTLEANDALTLAEDYLGPGYREAEPGRFVSSDGRRQVRLGNKDLLGKHAGAPHINFDRLLPTYKTSHVFFND